MTDKNFKRIVKYCIVILAIWLAGSICYRIKEITNEETISKQLIKENLK